MNLKDREDFQGIELETEKVHIAFYLFFVKVFVLKIIILTRIILYFSLVFIVMEQT